MRSIDLLPQVLHMLVYKIKISQIVGIIAPKVGCDGLPGQHPVLVNQEIKEQFKFLAGNVQYRSINFRFEHIGIQHDLVKGDEVAAFQLFAPVNGS